MSLLELFCDVDDFCCEFEAWLNKQQLEVCTVGGRLLAEYQVDAASEQGYAHELRRRECVPLHAKQPKVVYEHGKAHLASYHGSNKTRCPERPHGCEQGHEVDNTQEPASDVMPCDAMGAEPRKPTSEERDEEKERDRRDAGRDETRLQGTD